MLGEAAHVQFIDDGVGVGNRWGHISFPVIAAGINHHSTEGLGAIIDGCDRGFAGVVLPVDDGFSVGI